MFVSTQHPMSAAAVAGRNAAELIRDAMATGTYEHYQGDGFSVPWQVALPGNVPVAFILWSYKAYLDAHWPEAARIHDWCYTPYGALINVTRLEADNAIYELIAVDSVFDASVVYAAVRLGGGPFFGVSQTGYVGSQSQGSVPDIDQLPAIVEPVPKPSFARSIAMAWKVVMKVNGFTTKSPAISGGTGGLQQHGYGFSEHVWSPFNSYDAARLAFLNDLGPKRAALLPSNATLIGATFYQGGRGTGAFVGASLPGPNTLTDQVNVGLLCQSASGTAPNQSRFYIHNIPKSQISGGEFAPTASYGNLTLIYLAELANWAFVGSAPSRLQSIFEVDATGKVTTMAPHGFNVGDIVQIRRVFVGNGRRVGGAFIVSTVGPLNTQFTVSLWTFPAGRNGTVFIGGSSQYTLDGCNIRRLGTRRVGRPFDEYRGRRSPRRSSKV